MLSFLDRRKVGLPAVENFFSNGQKKKKYYFLLLLSSQLISQYSIIVSLT